VEPICASCFSETGPEGPKLEGQHVDISNYRDLKEEHTQYCK